MIFKNIDFHNVDELVKTENGYLMQRVNSDVLKHLFPAVQERIAYFGTGVELRFVIGSGEVEIDLFIDDNFSDGIVTARPTTVRVFYGDWQSGYKTPDFHLHPGLNTLKLSIPDESELLTKLDGAFDSRVVRIILPQNIIEFVDARGDIRLPDKSMYPEKTLLFYGSSITNGADATSVPSTFAFRTAKKLGVDYFNLGFSGNAGIEKEMAEYISARKDWDYACIELGANVYEYSDEKFDEYVKNFTNIMANDGRKVFCTDLFACYSDIFGWAEKSDKMRAAVKRHALRNNLFYIPGLSLLPPKPEYLTTDGVHPSVEGVAVLTENYISNLKKMLNI